MRFSPSRRFSQTSPIGGLSLFRRSRLLFLAFYLLAVIPAHAVSPDFWWLGNTDNLWNGQNWASDVNGTSTASIPGSGSNVTLSATGATNQVIQLNVDTTINSLVVSGDTLLTNNGISLTAPAGQTHTISLTGSTSVGLEPNAALAVTSAFTVNTGVTLVSTTSGGGDSNVIISGPSSTAYLMLSGGTLQGPSTAGNSSVNVGYGGRGVLYLQNGGTLTYPTLQIGVKSGDRGAVLASGSGSTINVSGSLIVGNQGSGTLNVMQGAVVTANSLYIAEGNSSSSAIVSGTGSQLNVKSAYIGWRGGLSILNGGSVTTQDVNLTQDYSTVEVDGSGSVWNTQSIVTGKSGTAYVDISNGGLVNVGGGSGTVILGQDSSSRAVLSIGGFGFGSNPAGALLAAKVTGGPGGGARVEFDQTDNITFSPQITGSIVVAQNGSGTTTLAQANTYTFGTAVNGGTLQTQNPSALGTSPVTLTGGTLRAVGTLNIGTTQAPAYLDWQSNTAHIALAPGQGDVINVTGSLIYTGSIPYKSSAYIFDIDPTGMTLGQPYVLLNFGSSNFTLSQFGATFFNTPYVFTYEFLTGEYGGNVEIVLLAESSRALPWDGMLHNFDIGVSPTANYTVNGAIYSGRTAAGLQEANTHINSILVAPGGALIIPTVNTLTIATDLTANAGNVFIEGSLHTLGNMYLHPGSQLVLDLGSFMTVGGTANFYGNTFVNVNGVLTAPFVHVSSGAFLEGKGAIVGNVLNSGIVAPGNSPGTLTIQGNYTQAKTGALQIQIASPSLYDHLVVSGTAKLGGTLQVQSLGANLAWGQEYSFLQAGKIVGSFDQIEMSAPSTFRGRLIENGTSEVLLVAPASYTLLAHNANEHSVALALDHWIGNPNKDVSAVTLALDLLPADQYVRAFAAISPAYYSLWPSTSIEQSISHVQMLDQRLGQIRAGATGFSFGGTTQGPSSGEGDKDTQDTKEPAVAIANDVHWGGFLQITGQFADVQTLQNLGDNHFNTVGALGGIDYRLDGKAVVGLAAGYEYTRLNYSAGDLTTMDDFRVSAYGNYNLGDGFFLNGIAGGAFTKYDVKRPIDFGAIDRTAVGSTRGAQFYSALEFGKDIDWGHWTFTPSATFQYTYLSISGLTEQDAGALGLRVNRQSASSYRTQFGALAAYHVETAGGAVFSPYISAYWEHEFSSEAAELEATLPDGGGSFNYAGTPMQRDRLLAGAGMMVNLGKNANLNLGYQADFASSTYTSHFIYMQVGVKF